MCRRPAPHNTEAFDAAVAAVAEATRTLLATIEVRGSTVRANADGRP
jgi:hypothetical protein